MTLSNYEITRTLRAAAFHSADCAVRIYWDKLTNGIATEIPDCNCYVSEPEPELTPVSSGFVVWDHRHNSIYKDQVFSERPDAYKLLIDTNYHGRLPEGTLEIRPVRLYFEKTND